MASLWLANKCLISIINAVAPNSMAFVRAQTTSQKIIGSISKYFWEDIWLTLDVKLGFSYS
jgi:uncharacterized membrane protein